MDKVREGQVIEAKVRDGEVATYTYKGKSTLDRQKLQKDGQG